MLSQHRINIAVCGGGSLGHVLVGWLATLSNTCVYVLTNHSSDWGNVIEIDTPEGMILKGKIEAVSHVPCEIIPFADIVILCSPGFLIERQIKDIKPYLKSTAFVGAVFSSTGFFFKALELLDDTQPLFGFQRVPFIARVNEYGKSAHLLGYKPSYYIAVEHCDAKGKEYFRSVIEYLFKRPTYLLQNYFEASLTNSNPILHTARLYSMFAEDNDGFLFDHQVLFYKEWDLKSADKLVEMDDEFFKVLGALPVRKDYIPRLLDYYESNDASSLVTKIRSISSFSNIYAPMLYNVNRGGEQITKVDILKKIFLSV